MEKWQLNLIISLMAVCGLQLISQDVNEYFYQVPVKAPVKAESQTFNSKTKSSENLKSTQDNQVQDVLKNDTIKQQSVQDTSGTMTLASLNQMDAQALESINGVGPVLAKRIFDYRNQNGPFKSLSELDEIKGIGPKMLAKIKAQFK